MASKEQVNTAWTAIDKFKDVTDIEMRNADVGHVVSKSVVKWRESRKEADEANKSETDARNQWLKKREKLKTFHKG